MKTDGFELPPAKHLRRQMRLDGGYDMVPAYTTNEVQAIIAAHIARQGAEPVATNAWRGVIHRAASRLDKAQIFDHANALRELLATPAPQEAQAGMTEQHRELFFATYLLLDSVCEDHPAIGDVFNIDAHSRVCNALAQLDTHYGVNGPDSVQRLAAPVAQPATEAGQGEREAWSEHYDEIKATLQGAHGIMENLSAMERKVGPLGSHGRGYTHKITKALRHLESLRAALATQPNGVMAAQDKTDADRWCWFHEGDETVTVLSSEDEAHGEAQQWIDDNCEPGEEHEYLVSPMQSGLDLLGSPEHIGESIIESINENLSDEMGAEEDPIDLSKEDITKLGELVREFVRNEGKVQWWTIDTKRQTKHTARAARTRGAGGGGL